MATSKRSRVARLMLKAVRGLPDKEQQVVLEHLVEAGLAGGAVEPAAAGGAQRAPEAVVRQAVLSTDTTMNIQRGALGPDHQMIPVRLSEPQHRLLKRWCADNGFPMAVVVRGLVERFLADRGELAG
ncbi:MAG: hypothetical protein ACR2GL_05240 [Thermoleophilaceae bacterium]